MEEGEHPEHTVLREYKEELGESIQLEDIALFGLTRITINNPSVCCKVHWDLWYVVDVSNRKQYEFDRGEYHVASWLSLDKALSMIGNEFDQRENYVHMLAELKG